MCDFALIMCRPSSRVMYASGFTLEQEAMLPLSPATALGGCSWSVHLASLLPLPSSQDGFSGVMGTQPISMSGTCRKWPAVGLPLKLVVRRYTCTRGIYDVWLYVMYATLEEDLPIPPLKEWYIYTNSMEIIPMQGVSGLTAMVSMIMMYALVYEVWSSLLGLIKVEVWLVCFIVITLQWTGAIMNFPLSSQYQLLVNNNVIFYCILCHGDFVWDSCVVFFPSLPSVVHGSILFCCLDSPNRTSWSL